MIGDEIYKFAKELWPYNRSITGDGLRDTLTIISKHLPALK
jgi:aminopeptidase-like protein